MLRCRSGSGPVDARAGWRVPAAWDEIVFMASTTSLTRLDHPATDSRLLRDAFSCFPSGVVALCSLIDGVPVGMVASTFACVSLAPALVSVCIQRASNTWARLKHASSIGVSCLSAAQGEACRQLAAKSGDRFAGLDWAATEAGAILLDGATALFDCRVHSEIPAGDHEIILLEISAIRMHPELEPLVFHGSTFRAFEARGSAAA